MLELQVIAVNVVEPLSTKQALDLVRGKVGVHLLFRLKFPFPGKFRQEDIVHFFTFLHGSNPLENLEWKLMAILLHVPHGVGS